MKKMFSKISREPTIFLFGKTWRFSHPYHRQIVIFITLSVLANLIILTVPLIFAHFLNEIQQNGKLLPTRGNIHDLSGAITHKREIITLYLQGYLTPDIALKTNHSKEAVDRYIKDYHKVETLWMHGINDLDEISQLTKLSKRVAQQYIDLLPTKLKNSLSKNSENETDLTNQSHFP